MPDLIIAAIGAVNIEDMFLVPEKASVSRVCPFKQIERIAVLVYVIVRNENNIGLRQFVEILLHIQIFNIEDT